MRDIVTRGGMRMMKAALPFLFVAGLALGANATTLAYSCKTSGSPGLVNMLYGYISNTEGPGPEAFTKSLNLALERHRPLLVITGTDSCSGCSAFAQDWNSRSSDHPMTLQGYCVNTYFRGNAKASQDAKAFVDGLLNEVNAGSANHTSRLISARHTKGYDHVIAMYGVYEDGCKFIRTQNMVTTYEDFKYLYNDWVDEFKSLISRHRITAGARFVNKNTQYAQLQALASTKTVAVPLKRDTNYTSDESDTFTVTYPKDGRKTTQALVWAVGERSKTVNVPLEGEWVDGKTVKMQISDANGNPVDNSEIHFVAGGNSFSFPDLVFDKDGGWGTWTLYSEDNWAGVTQKVHAANAFVLKVTGGSVWNADAVAFASVLESGEFMEWCQSNKVATVLCECSDPDTGASLFSHAAAANGHSGSAFLSRNGIEAESVQPPVSNVFEVALYRPDGSFACMLAPQISDRTCDTAENIARLCELVEIAGDETEPSSDDGATTTLAAGYMGQIATNTVGVSDKKDVVALDLDGAPAGALLSLGLDTDPIARNNRAEKPRLYVWRYGTAERTNSCEIAAIASDPGGNPVWRFSGEDVAMGVYADVTAWTDDYARTGCFASTEAGGTVFGYTLAVSDAPKFPGEVSFYGNTNLVCYADSETVVEFKVNRTGYTGAATATLEMTTCELPETSYSWVHDANGRTNLVWQEGESGVKTVYVTIRDVLWEDSASNLVFTITGCEGASLDAGRNVCGLSVQQDDDENALTGVISIAEPESVAGEDTWMLSGDTVEVTVVRKGVYNPASGKYEVRGEATADLAASGGATITERDQVGKEVRQVEWVKGNRTGERPVVLTLPEVGAAGQQQVVFSVYGRDCDGKPIHDPARSRLKFMVVPDDAPTFADGIAAEAYQYIAFSKETFSSVYDPDEMEVVEAAVLSGSIPDGLALSAFSAPADGGAVAGIRVEGVPSGSASSEAMCQLTLRRVAEGDKKGYLVKTKPVPVKISGRPLGGDGTAASGAIIPGFSQRRIWQYLPMTNGSGRLVGMMNLSASAVGAVSSRYTDGAGRTVAFSTNSLAEVKGDAASGYRANVSMYKAGYVNDVTFFADGAVDVAVSVDGGSARYLTDPGSAPWMNQDGGAARWRGQYVAAFPADAHVAAPCGTAAISVNAQNPSVAKTGKVSYSGVLPNGRPIAGATAFLPTADANVAKLPIVWHSANDSFSAMLTATMSEGVATISLDPAVTPCWNGEPFGCEAVGSTFAAAEWPATMSFRYGGEAGLATVAADGQGFRVANPGSADGEGGFALESITLNRGSGMVTGSLRVSAGGGQVATASFRGVALPRGGKCLMRGVAWYAAEQDGVVVRAAAPVELVPADAE